MYWHIFVSTADIPVLLPPVALRGNFLMRSRDIH